MENIDIKQYLNIKKQEEIKNKNSNYSSPKVSYEIVIDNGCDLIIRRTSGTGIKKDLCVIPSECLVFIRDVKKEIDKEIFTEGDISQFFKYMHNSELQDLLKKIKNSFYHMRFSSDLGSRLLSIKKDELVREFLKRGLNPYDYYTSYSSEKKNFIFNAINN